MRAGYSKLLITDAVVPETGATLLHATLDMAMMTNGAEEKSETVFREMLDNEGFVIQKIWRSQKGVDAIIEAEILQ